jgi:hypothetical protein
MAYGVSIYTKFKKKIITYMKEHDHLVWGSSLKVCCESSTCANNVSAENSGVFMPALGRYYCFQPNCTYNKDNAPNGKSHSVVDYIIETNGFNKGTYQQTEKILEDLIGFYEECDDIFEVHQIEKVSALQPIKNIDFIVPAIAKAPLYKELKEYLNNRGFDIEELYKRYKIGYVNDPESKHYGYLYIPFYSGDKLIFYQYRDFLGRPYKGQDKVLRWGNPPVRLCRKGKSQMLYNFRKDAEIYILVEGIVDTWELEIGFNDLHINAVSCLGSDLSRDQYELFANSKAKEIWVAFDAGTYKKSLAIC